MPRGKYERTDAWREAQRESQRKPSEKRKAAQAERRRNEELLGEVYRSNLDLARESKWEPERALDEAVISFAEICTDEEMRKPFLVGLLRKYAQELDLNANEADLRIKKLIAGGYDEQISRGELG